jgi:uncharacterized protein YxeA
MDMNKTSTKVGLVIALIVVLVLVSTLFRSSSKEYTLMVGQSVQITKSDDSILQITLDSVDIPKVIVPGNEAFYHLTMTNGSRLEKVTFDANNSGKEVTYLDVKMQISEVEGTNNLIVRVFSK